MRQLLFIITFALTVILTPQLKAQCNKTAKELEQLSLMDTTKFKAYAMKHGIDFDNRNEDFLEFHCGNYKSTKFIIKYTTPKWFQYEFVDTAQYFSIYKQLRDRGYNIIAEDLGQTYASKTFSFEIIATDGGFYEIMIRKREK
jgi:hypothetical protein